MLIAPSYPTTNKIYKAASVKHHLHTHLLDRLNDRTRPPKTLQTTIHAKKLNVYELVASERVCWLAKRSSIRLEWEKREKPLIGAVNSCRYIYWLAFLLPKKYQVSSVSVCICVCVFRYMFGWHQFLSAAFLRTKNTFHTHNYCDCVCVCVCVFDVYRIASQLSIENIKDENLFI